MTATGSATTDRTTPLPAVPPLAWRPVAVIAGLVAALLFATSNGYGYHRDELYFLMLDPAWGYRDQPPLTPLLAQLAEALFGGTLWGLRVPAVLCVVAALLLAALLARELGGGTAAQTFAALGAGTGAMTLIFGHVLLTATVDLVVWLAVIWCVTRALLRGQPRWWAAAGVLVGIGLYNKLLIVLLLLGLAIGLLAGGPRRTLADRWLWGGVALALLVGAPNIVYQLTHDLPQLEMAGAIAERKGDESRLFFVPFQFILVGVLLVPIWVAGLVGLLRRPRWRPVRALGLAYPVVCLLVLLAGGQPYYTYPLLVALLAAGCVVVTERAGRLRPWVVLAFGLNAVTSALVALPLVPVGMLGTTPIPAINQTARDSVGWTTYANQVVRVYEALPAAERERAVVVTGNYGEAGALSRFAGNLLPSIHSGHNELWYRGAPPESATVMIGVGIGEPDRWAAHFERCRLAGRLDNLLGVENEEQGRPVVICHEPTAGWAALWPRFAHHS